jgi:hypothetical protein
VQGDTETQASGAVAPTLSCLYYLQLNLGFTNALLHQRPARLPQPLQPARFVLVQQPVACTYKFINGSKLFQRVELCL